MALILHDLLLFSFLAAFITGIVIAVARQCGRERTYWQDGAVQAIDQSQEKLAEFMATARPRTSRAKAIRGLRQQQYVMFRPTP